MQGFVRFSFGYFLVAVVATIAVRGTTDHLAGIVGFALSTIKYMGAGPWVLWLSPLALYFAWRHPRRGRDAVVAFWATIVLVSGYTLIKAAIPVTIPFWADGLLADWDRSLHGGSDPWRLAHGLRDWISTDGAAMTYSGYWGAFAFAFPAFLMLGDSDPTRRLRYLALYASAWVVLGNVVAMLFSSAGPIYADMVTGGDAFAPMRASLADLTFPGTSIERVQTKLWEAYAADGGLQLSGSGISAFPSMHVAIATIWALYVSERAWFYAPVAIAFAATILFLSVYTGWHYAVDGYASVVGVLALHAVVRQLARRNAAKTQRKTLEQIDPMIP